jgi:peptidyl-prolyl cis-trans isomerase C
MTARELLTSFGKLAIATGVLVLSLVLTFGCSRENGGSATGARDRDGSPVVARVGDGSITGSDLKSYWSDKPMSNRQRLSKEALEALLDERVVEEVLYREALRQGLDQDQEIRRDIRQMLIGRFMHEHMNREVWSKEIEEAELQEYYDEHRSEFNRPEQVRIADIFIAVPPDATDVERSEAKDRAEGILAEALESRGKRSGFGMLVREHSDTPQKYRKGDTGFFDEEGMPLGIPGELVEAAFALERVGSVAERVIEAADGYHVIMLTGRRSSVHIPLEKVRRKLEQRMRREAAEKARKALIDGLKARAEIRVDDQVLTSLLEDLNSEVPAAQPYSGKEGAPPASQGDLSPPALPGR